MAVDRATQFRATLLVLLLTPWIASAPVTAAGRGRYIDFELVADTAAPAPGKSFWIGLRMVPKPGWHGYWNNPGGSGLAPNAEWKAPATLRFGPLQHPAPTVLRVAGITSYVHAGSHVLLSRVELASDVPVGTRLPVTVEASWAACSDRLCVPEHASIAMELVAGDGRPGNDAALIKRSVLRLPRPASAGTFAVAQGKVSLEPPPGLKLNAARLHFFPDRNGFLNAGDIQVSADERLRLLAPLSGAPPSSLTGVLSDGMHAYRLTFRKGDLATPAPRQQPKAANPSSDQDEAALRALQQPSRSPAGDANVAATPMSPPPAWLASARSALVMLALALGAFAIVRRSDAQR